MIKTYIWNHSHIRDNFNNNICNRTQQFAQVDNDSSVDIYTSFTNIIKDAYDNKYDCIEVIGNGCIVGSASQRHKVIESLEGECYAHILHTGLWESVNDENFYTLHEQYIILRAPAIAKLQKINLDKSVEIFRDFPTIERSIDNIHDNYTPLWIKKLNDNKIQVSKGGSCGKLEKIIEVLISNNITIYNIPQEIRWYNNYSYHNDNLDLAKEWFYKPLFEIKKNKHKINPAMFIFLEWMKGENKLWAYNTEDYNFGDDLKFDTLITPAAGHMPFAYLIQNKFNGTVNVYIIDINQHTIDLCAWFIEHFDPNIQQEWSTYIDEFTEHKGLQHILILGDKDAANEQWITIYKDLKTKWNDIKANTIFHFHCGDIIEDKHLYTDALEKADMPFAHLSNVFRFEGTFEKNYTVDSVKEYVHFLYRKNMKANFKILVPEHDICFSHILPEQRQKKIYYKIIFLPGLKKKIILQEIKRLEENNMFVKHTDSPQSVWESFVLSDTEANCNWKKEALEFCPQTVKYFQNYMLRKKKHFKIQVMKLAPNSFINIDMNNNDGPQWTLNISLSNPNRLEMHCWDNNMIYQGQVPLSSGKAYGIKAQYNFIVRNLSNTTQYYISAPQIIKKS